MSRPEPLRTLPEQVFRARARLVALLLCGICFAGLLPGSTGCSWPPGTGTPGGHWGSSCGTPWCPPTGAASTVPTACCWRPTAAAGPCGPARGRCLPTNWSWPPTVLRRFWSWTKPPCWKSSGTVPPTTVCCATGWSVPWRMPCGISARKRHHRHPYQSGQQALVPAGGVSGVGAGLYQCGQRRRERAGAGIQRAAHRQNGVVLTAVNAWGYTLEQSYETEQFPVEGSSLWLTIDATFNIISKMR